MSQQGERPTSEDDWWGRLYDETARDTGASRAGDEGGPSGAGDAGDVGDSLDDRFDSVAKTVGPVRSGGSDGTLFPEPEPEPEPEPPLTLRARAPWEPPEEDAPAPGAAPARPPSPRTFIAFTTPPTPTGPPAALTPSTPAATPPPPAEPPAAFAPPTPPLPRRPVTDRSVDTGSRLTAQARADAEERGREAECERAPAPAAPRPARTRVSDRPPTYDAEPTALPLTVPQELDGLVAADTVLDGARYGTYTLRAASVRGDSARFRGEHRRDALLTARFGTGREALVLVAVATGARACDQAHLAAADACRWIGGAIGRSHLRLSEDIRGGRRGELKSGLRRLTDRGFGRLRARAAELGLESEQYTAGLRCLLLSADPDCRTRIFFGVGAGGLFLLRDGGWQDLEPGVLGRAGVLGRDFEGADNSPLGENGVNNGSGENSGRGGNTREAGQAGSASGDPSHPEAAFADGDRPAEPFRFRALAARSGDMLLLCSPGLAAPLRGAPALAGKLAERWTGGEAPGLAAFLTDVQLRAKGYSDDRTSAAVWEA
ncbi:protein phosphatase 2C domain-containing protein [Streptomyces sp. NPDC001834]|uniref:protein phosphatase 2C domain-containing protein n=1 Tax=Streptomyces sp. NPDC001834 TaxID=3364616 RepID=UPI0036C252A5